MQVKTINRIIFACLFLTGFAGGVYESLFANEIIYIVGVSIKAISVTISSFFLGLGIGGYLIGRRIDKLSIKNKEKEFIKIELILIISVILGYVGLQLVPLIKLAALSIILNEILVLSSTFGMLFIMSFLMGGEIPIVLSIRKSLRKSKKIDIGELSGWGNLADAIGGGLSFLIPWFLPFYLGIQNTLIVTVLLNVASTLLMLFVFYRTIESEPKLREDLVLLTFKKTKRKRRFISPHGRMAKYINKMAKHKFLITCVTIIFIANLFIFDVGGLNKTTSTYFQQLLYRDHLLYSQQSPYQHIDIVQHPYWGHMLFLDYDLQLTSRDEYIYHESLVHVAMLTHPNPKHVLIIGGGDGGALREVCKYNVDTITLVELDPFVVLSCRTHLPIDYGSFFDSRVKVYYMDGRKFLETAGYYDVIIVDLPDPDNFVLAMLYTVEFYESVFDHLDPGGGVFVTQSTSCYFNLFAFTNIYQTIYTVFGEEYTYPYHNIVPSLGDWGFIIATKAISSLPSADEIHKRINERNLYFISFSTSQYEAYFSFPQYVNKILEITPYTPSYNDYPIVMSLTLSRKSFTFRYYGQSEFQELIRNFIGPITIIGLITIISFFALRKKKPKYFIYSGDLKTINKEDQIKKVFFKNN